MESESKNVRMLFSMEEKKCSLFKRVFSDRRKLTLILQSIIGSCLREADTDGTVNVSFKVLQEQVCEGSNVSGPSFKLKRQRSNSEDLKVHDFDLDGSKNKSKYIKLKIMVEYIRQKEQMSSKLKFSKLDFFKKLKKN
jgi:hypothetical protein